MSGEGDRRIGWLLGLLGAALIFVEGVLDLIGGAISTALGRNLRPFGWFDHGVILLVFGILAGFFALLGRSRREDQGLAAGIVLVVLVVAGWLVLGLANGLLPVIGSLLVLVAGVLYLAASR